MQYLFFFLFFFLNVHWQKGKQGGKEIESKVGLDKVKCRKAG